jgi:hypothetical protein
MYAHQSIQLRILTLTDILDRFPETFPVKLIWATPSFMILGGGVSMASAMIYTVANDISSEAQRYLSYKYLSLPCFFLYL